jgi:hypothetical protein
VKVAGIYEVVGRRTYREHPPGAVFEAAMDARHEARALARGDIKKLASTTPALQPGSYTLPPGWTTKNEEVQNRG